MGYGFLFTNQYRRFRWTVALCWQRKGEVSTSDGVRAIIFKKIFSVSTQSINFSYPAILFYPHIP